MRLRWYPPAALGREGQSVVGALQVAEPLAAAHVAPLEAQLGEAEAADAGRGRALPRGPGGGGGRSRGDEAAGTSTSRRAAAVEGMGASSALRGPWDMDR